MQDIFLKEADVLIQLYFDWEGIGTSLIGGPLHSLSAETDHHLNYEQFIFLSFTTVRQTQHFHAMPIGQENILTTNCSIIIDPEGEATLTAKRPPHFHKIYHSFLY
jgi:hypothetical protein